MRWQQGEKHFVKKSITNLPSVAVQRQQHQEEVCIAR